MKAILTKASLVLLALATPAGATAQGLEGKWANPKRSVIVRVDKCGNAWCGNVSWANPHNQEKGMTPGTRVLSNLHPVGDGIYKGSAFDPKRDMGGSATVRQVGPDIMVVKGCALLNLVCKEQRWTRVS